MKILVIIIFLIISLNTLAQTHTFPPPDQFSTIKRKHYALNYPTPWAVDTSKLLGVDLIILSPKLDSADSFRENVTVFSQSLKDYGYTLQKMGEESEKQVKNMVTEVEILENRLDTTKPVHCYILKYKGRQGIFLLTTEQRYYLKDEIGYAITFTGESINTDKYSLLSQKIFESFKME